MFQFTISDGGSLAPEHSIDNDSHKQHPDAAPVLLEFFESPAKNATEDNLHFELRHQSNTLELFFDLFFIANLSTFTATHSIIDLSTLVAYIGLFGILWFTWFQITMHDVRFAIDSVYERVCKVIQFIIFVGFALVGSSFNPGGKEHNNEIFQVLCWILFISRLLLAIQYSVVLFFVRKKTTTLTLPLSMTIGSFVLCAGSYYAMTPAFAPASGNGMGIYYVWYIILGVETAVVIGTASVWRNLSFKKTHLMERMGLLTLIVIGEGAIGVTKTVGKLMTRSGVTLEETALTICIVLILVFLWMMYFDNHPHYHYGTIRQQIWAGLHFPLHLAIVGVVEGSQQIALSRFVFKQLLSVQSALVRACVTENLDGTELASSVISAIENLNLKNKEQTALIIQDVYNASNMTGVCSVANTTNLPELAPVPAAFFDVLRDTFGAVFEATDIKLPSDIEPVALARTTFFTIYVYYWSSIGIVFVASATLLWLTRHKEHRPKQVDIWALIGRALAALFAMGMLAAAASKVFLYRYIRSSAILPTVTVLIFLVVCFDRTGRQLGRRATREYIQASRITSCFRGVW
ncbi:hypothetical protein PVAG01_01946 [Phlyctema vagabunda]|uniref:Low temperature requirement A n=1 Tax=Phlyctema vagabunda TaxID=108571 RepID=A0ABR4PZ44_9HELO